jgi:predicted AlkP superfamily pyrophosphatase or phosphodiesterase
VVLLVVDQFRADYAEMYGRHWTGGLHELLTRGASFTRAAYTFALTKTCAGHATIGTGTIPATHGMIDNEWFDPVTRTFTTCTEDPAARPMVYGGKTGRERHSARWLKVPTFADELIRQSGGRARVASVAVKPRSAITLGGRGGPTTTHVWSEDLIATWSTSSAMAERLSPEVEAYVRAHPVELVEPLSWTRAAPDSVYQFADEAPGEPSGAAGVFPHLFGVPIRTSASTATLLDAWETTPFPDAFVGGLTAHLAETQRLGQRDGTDLLAVSFSALDAVGHRYGPRSHEVQDTLYRLDKVIGDLLRVLDARVGRDRYVVAFSSDHGVGPMPEQVFPPPPLGGRGRGTGGSLQEGRASATAIGNAVENLLDERLGRASYVEALFGSYFYFRPGVLDRIRKDPELTRAVEAAARGARGVSRVYWASDLAATTPTDDSILRMMRRSYVPGRSGDLVYVLERNWVTGSDATHGSPYDYDTRVPVVFYGAGITPGQYTSDASPADIVPTLSVLTGVKMPRTDGQVLREAIGR